MAPWNEGHVLRAILLGIPISCISLWEYRRGVEKQHLDSIKLQFTGGTPFYGKRWGHTTDYMIDQSLKTGDLIFISYKAKGLHFWDALVRRVSRWISCTIWDDVFMVIQKYGEQKYLVSLKEQGGLELELYCEKIAKSFPMTVTVRRLQCSDDIRKRLLEVVDDISTQATAWRLSSIARTLTLYRRSQGLVDSKLDWCRNMIELNRSIKILELNITRLHDVLNDFDQYMQTRQIIQTAADKELRCCVELLLNDYKASLNDLMRFHRSNPDANNAPIVSSTESVGTSTILKWAEYPIKGLSLAEQFLNSTASTNITTNNFMQSIIDKIKMKVSHQIVQKKSILHKTPVSTAQLVASIYQKAGLFPFTPASIEWTIEDFYMANELLNPMDPDVQCSGLLAAGPLMSRPFHVREEAPDAYSLKMAQWQNRYTTKDK